jgi:hypothetical protein
VIRLRARGEYIGTVSAPDQQAALKAAIKAFELKAADSDRLLGRPSQSRLMTLPWQPAIRHRPTCSPPAVVEL